MLPIRSLSGRTPEGRNLSINRTTQHDIVRDSRLRVDVSTLFDSAGSNSRAYLVRWNGDPDYNPSSIDGVDIGGFQMGLVVDRGWMNIGYYEPLVHNGGASRDEQVVLVILR